MRLSELPGSSRSESMNASLPLASVCVAVFPGDTTGPAAALPGGSIEMFMRSAPLYQMSTDDLRREVRHREAYGLRCAGVQLTARVPVARAFVAGRLHEHASRAGQQVVDAALEQARAVVRTDVVALALVDDDRPPFGRRDVEDVLRPRRVNRRNRRGRARRRRGRACWPRRRCPLRARRRRR